MCDRGSGKNNALGARFARRENLPDLFQLTERVGLADPALSGLIRYKRSVGVDLGRDRPRRVRVRPTKDIG